MASISAIDVAGIWASLSSYIPAKERLAAAEALIRLCDELGFTEEDFYDMMDDNKVLETAHTRHFAEVEDEEEDWDE
jgi:hypothetical protein